MPLKPFRMQLSTGIALPPHLRSRERLRRYESDCRVISRKIGAFCGGSRLTGLKAALEFACGLFRLSRAESTPIRVSSRQTESSHARTMMDEAFERSMPPV
jgi:hypothetical protein